jgi:hypothetical protein
VNNKYAGIQTAESTAYFSKIVSVSNEAWAHFLYSRDISSFNPNQQPKTELVQEQAVLGYDSVKTWWLACLEDGQVGNYEIESSFGSFLSKDAVFLAYKEQSTGGYARVMNQVQFWKRVRD